MPPVRDAIDALLQDGATVAPNVLKAPAKDGDLARVHEASSPAHGYDVLDAKLKTIDAKTNKAADKTAKGRKGDWNHSNFQPNDSDIDDDEDSTQQLRKQQPKGKAKRVESPPADQKRDNLLLMASDESRATTHEAKTAINGETCRASKTPAAGEAHKVGVNKASRGDAKPVRVAGNGKARAGHDPTGLVSLSQPHVGEPSGRPVRKAKKKALGKLTAKRGKENDDVMSRTDDESEDNVSSFVAEDNSAQVSGRGQGRTKAHLPTPATKGNIPKRYERSKQSGKLQSIKSKAPLSKASVKKVSEDRRRPGATAAGSRIRRDISLLGESSFANSTEAESYAPEEHGSRKILAPVNGDEQGKLGGNLSTKRPGALKQPTRSASRGRKPLRESLYDFPGSTPRTKKKSRSVSKAPRASFKPGAIRQRMQSESVKHQDDSDINTSHQSSTSQQAASKDIEPGKSLNEKSKTQRKSKELHPAPSGTHENKSALQSKRTDVAAKVITQKNATRQKPGSSQANAITIEQAAESSSSPPSSPDPSLSVQPNATDHNSRIQKGRRLKTQVPMPSSPPCANTEASHTFASDKPKIIAFDKRGPRNQGIASSSKDRGSTVAPTVTRTRGTADAGPSSLHGQTKMLARTLFPSQPEDIVQSQRQASSTAVPTNLLVNGENPLTDFIKNRNKKALTSLLQRPPNAAPQSIKRKPGPERDCDDEDGFFVVDYFDDTTLVNDDEASGKPDVHRTASQVAMPPPKGSERVVKKVTAQNSLLNESAKAMPISKTFEAAPNPGKLKKAVVATTTTKTAVEPNPAKQATTVKSKNGAQSASLHKATKMVPSHNTAEAKSSKEVLTEQKAQPKRKRELDELQSGAPNKKKANNLQTNPPKALNSDDLSSRQLRSSKIPQVPAMVEVELQDRRQTRPSRQATQVSQGVDILGSPYPKDFEVPMQTTALETFSQQADLSSDQIDATVAGGLTGRLNLTTVPQISTFAQRKSVSGNVKPLPAAPNQGGRAATRTASGSLAEQLITAKHEQSMMEDPFTSSHRRMSTIEYMTKGPDFKHALRKHGIFIDQQERSAVRDDDPDKTLVDPIEDPDSDGPREIASSPAASDEVSIASTASAAQQALENVGDWRNTLKPHQTHIFDSLVIASHKLVRHMVDGETANCDIVSDYRRQGEIVVTELERTHARESQKYAAGMQDWKKRAADELALHGRRLRQDLKDAERVRAERMKARLSHGGFDVLLEELVAGLG